MLQNAISSLPTYLVSLKQLCWNHRRHRRSPEGLSHARLCGFERSICQVTVPRRSTLKEQAKVRN